MTKKIIEVSIKETKKVPYVLLLLADPSKRAIDEYIKKCFIFVANINNTNCGVIALYPHNKQKIEIKNIAVSNEYQNRGIGSQLIDFAIIEARKLNYKYIEIGTGNSSLGQLYLYQKKGFRITRIVKDFFVHNYSEPILENGLECKDMIILTKET